MMQESIMVVYDETRLDLTATSYMNMKYRYHRLYIPMRGRIIESYWVITKPMYLINGGTYYLPYSAKFL